MAYTKQTWADGDASRPLSASRLNHIEDGLYEVSQQVENGGGGGTGDVQASDVYAVRRRTGDGTGPWQPANRGNFAGIIWVGVDPSSIEQQPGDIRYVPVEG